MDVLPYVEASALKESKVFFDIRRSSGLTEIADIVGGPAEGIGMMS